MVTYDAAIHHAMLELQVEALDFEVPCNSWVCSSVLNKPEHSAQWIVSATCNCDHLWCDDRLGRYKAHRLVGVGAFQCKMCDTLMAEVIGWIPIGKISS